MGRTCASWWHLPTCLRWDPAHTLNSHQACCGQRLWAELSLLEFNISVSSQNEAYVCVKVPTGLGTSVWTGLNRHVYRSGYSLNTNTHFLFFLDSIPLLLFFLLFCILPPLTFFSPLQPSPSSSPICNGNVMFSVQLISISERSALTEARSLLPRVFNCISITTTSCVCVCESVLLCEWERLCVYVFHEIWLIWEPGDSLCHVKRMLSLILLSFFCLF